MNNNEKCVEAMKKFIGREVIDISLLKPIFEMFNPNNPQVTDEYLEDMTNCGEEDREKCLEEGKLKENEFVICGNKKLTLTPDALPPQGWLDGEAWIGLKDLNGLLGRE